MVNFVLIDFIFNIRSKDIIAYDIETYKHCFTFYAIHVDTGQEWYFEISEYRNDLKTFIMFFDICIDMKVTWVGYNNIGFDYPVVHWIYKSHMIESVTCSSIHDKATQIIKSDSFSSTIWPNDRLVNQLDLYKIHHFDNRARATSLKVLEFNMRMDNIEDLPFPVDAELSESDIVILKD